MTYNFKFVTNLTKEDFHKFEQQENIKSHFLGSYEWGELSTFNGRKPHYVGVKIGNELIATAVLLQKSLFAGYSYFYCPRGFCLDYNNTELLTFFTKNIDTYCKSHKSIFLKIDPDIKLHTIDEYGNEIEGVQNFELVATLKKLGFKHFPLNYYFENEQPRFTFRIDLSNDIDAIESRYSKTTKNQIKYASKNHIEVFKSNIDGIAEFNRLMAMTEKRQGFYSHDKEYYSKFYQVLQTHDMIDLYLARINVPELIKDLTDQISHLNDEIDKLKDATNKKSVNRRKEFNSQLQALERQLTNAQSMTEQTPIISAYLLVRYCDKAWTLYAANDMDYGKFYANYLVYRELIRDCKTKGVKTFDVFGTIGKKDADGHLWGLHEFKKKWGGEFTEFIGEFDLVENKFMYFVYKHLIPVYHKFVKWRLHKKAAKQ